MRSSLTTPPWRLIPVVVYTGIESFNEAMKAAYEDMYQDTKAIRERRAMKRKAMQEKMAAERKETTEHHH